MVHRLPDGLTYHSQANFRPCPATGVSSTYGKILSHPSHIFLKRRASNIIFLLNIDMQNTAKRNSRDLPDR